MGIVIHDLSYSNIENANAIAVVSIFDRFFEYCNNSIIQKYALVSSINNTAIVVLIHDCPSMCLE